MALSPFPDLREFYDPALVLPIGGKTYRIAAPSQADTLAVRAVLQGAEVSDGEYLDRIMALLGAARAEDGAYSGGLVDEMTADGLSWPELLRVAETAALHFGESETRARAWWSAELLADVVTQAAADQADTAPEVEPEPVKRKPRKNTARKAK